MERVGKGNNLKKKFICKRVRFSNVYIWNVPLNALFTFKISNLSALFTQKVDKLYVFRKRKVSFIF